ncbi:MAG: hypothetical protein COB66_01405 [Coxiella sp. (in: Bacteria)]|nr:MAG: hypothetical protein COB66_01405 [Coxiella sp. (in: g-proteobacteria)]
MSEAPLENQDHLTDPVQEVPVGPNVIGAVNPTPEEMKQLIADIKINHNFNVDVKEATFNFKRTKDAESGIETIRESVQLAVPYVSVQGIVDILESVGVEEGQPNKGLELLLEAMETITNTAARALLAEDAKLNAATFPLEKITWQFIANQPKAQRRGGGIPKETWEGFAEDYVAVMVSHAGKTVDQATRAAKLLHGKLASCKTATPVLELLVDQLAIYAEKTEAAEEYQDCIDFLVTRADQYLNITDEELLSAL